MRVPLQSGMPRPVPDTGSSFFQRLGYYALGIAFGLLILGWVQVQKAKMKHVNAPAGSEQVESGSAVDATHEASDERQGP